MILTTLKLYFRGTNYGIYEFFQSIPHLYFLAIDTATDFCRDGRRWEHVITNYLPKLEMFHFRTQGELIDKLDKEEQIDNILDLFRGHFWLDERQWFVQCHWTSSGNMYLYTLPYAFSYFHIENMHSTSTCPYADKCWSFDSVHTLSYEYSLSSGVILPNFQFSSIKNLKLRLPIDNHFFLVIGRLNKLVTLTVSAIVDYDPSQLQAIIDRATHLYSLSFNKWLTNQQMYQSVNLIYE